jgi:hypothetical protein
MPRVEEPVAVGARAMEHRTERPAHALRSRRFHRLGGGTFHTAPFRTPGNKRWPEPQDDLHNSLLTTFFRYPLLAGRLLIGPFS